MFRRLFNGFLVSAFLIAGTGITAYAQSPDLDGDGNVGFADFVTFSQRYQLFARQGDATFDATVDFDGSGMIMFEDYLMFALNFGRSASNISLTLPSEPGTHSGAAAILDLDAGNQVDGGIRAGTVSGAGTTFSVDLFTEKISSPVSGIHAIFNIDPSKVKVVGVTGAQGLSLMGQPVTTSFVLGSLTGFTPGAGGFVATVEFQTVTDATGVPLTLQLERLIVAEGDGRTNALDVTGAKISLNTQSGTGGGSDGGTGTDGGSTSTDKFSLDLNADAGNQGEKALGGVTAGQLVKVQLFGNDLTNLKQYRFDLEYNASHLRPVDGTQGTLTEGFVAPGLDVTVPAVVTFGGATLGGPEIAGSGHLATVEFEVLSGLVSAGETTVRLASLGYGLSSTTLTTFAPDQTVVIQTAALNTGGGDGGTGEGDGGAVTPSAGDGTWTLDLNATVGDQAVRELTVAAGTEFTVEFLNHQGVTNSIGGQLSFAFDQTKVEFVSGSINGIAPLLGSPAVEGDTLRFTLATLSGVAVDQGHVGEVKFKTADSFTGETAIVLASASIGNAENFAQLESAPNVSVVIREGVATVVANPDFDGDGEIGFRDFVAFAQRYGSKLSDPLYDATLDLNSDDEIGFRDFILFAQVYGKAASAFVPPGQ